MPDINDVLKQGRYRIVNHLGQNGTGQLYEAYDNVQAANVVLKELPLNLNKVTTPAQMESLKLVFAAEAKILSEITHDSFIRVSDYFSEAEQNYLVMESAEGDYLSEMLDKTKLPFSLTEVTAWADQLLEALNYLHTQSLPVIHRDVRPQNVKLTLAGQIKLLALSIAKNADAKTGAAISNPGFDAATLHYLPLEQIWGKLDLASQKVIANSYSEGSVDILMQPPDARSDIYSLGATLYHLLTARRPVDALERSIDILEGKPDPLPIPSKLNPGVPPEISYVLMKAMEIKRESRFDSVIMMRQVLRTAVVRVKERETKEGKKPVEAPTHAVSLTPQNQPVHEHADVKHSSVETEADLNRQMELIKVRLREAEAQRLKAEQRAAEAEKRLLEKENHDVAHDVVAYGAPALAEDNQLLDLPHISLDPAFKAKEEETSPMLDIPKTHHQPAKPAAAKEFENVKEFRKEPAASDFEFSYSGEEPKDKKVLWKALAAAACLLVFGVAGFGIWSLASQTSDPSKSMQTPAMSLTDTAKPETAPETAPQTQTQNAENVAATNSPADPGETPAQAGTPLEARPGSSMSAAQIAAQKEKDKAKKQPVQTAKAPTPQKKAVTVDDLINDR